MHVASPFVSMGARGAVVIGSQKLDGAATSEAPREAMQFLPARLTSKANQPTSLPRYVDNQLLKLGGP